jgi:hypothetical protein
MLVWKGRNQLVFNKTPFNPIAIAAECADFIAEFNPIVYSMYKGEREEQCGKSGAPNLPNYKNQ